MKSPFLNMSAEQLQAIQKDLDDINKIIANKNSELRGVINSLLIISPASELNQTINKLRDPKWIQKMESMQQSIGGLRKSALPYFGKSEWLKYTQKQYKSFALENQNLLKNLDGHSVFFY